MLDNRLQIHTLKSCVTLIAFPQQQWLYEPLQCYVYTYFACLVIRTVVFGCIVIEHFMCAFFENSTWTRIASQNCPSPATNDLLHWNNCVTVIGDRICWTAGISFASLTQLASAVRKGHPHTLMMKYYIIALTRNPKTWSSCCVLQNSEPIAWYEEEYITQWKQLLSTCRLDTRDWPTAHCLHWHTT